VVSILHYEFPYVQHNLRTSQGSWTERLSVWD
jgi:hypothetical protein